MAVTRLSTKGQVVLPKDLREGLGLQPGTELQIDVRDGAIVLLPIRRHAVDALIGLLQYDGPAKTVEEMDAAIARAAQR